MVNRITPNRNEVNATFRSASFRIRTDVVPAWVEIALATDPTLFAGDARARRTHASFYSTRDVGPIPVPGGDAVWIAPENVLERFVGQPRLYYALAVYPSPDRKNPQLVVVVPEAAPFVAISRSFTGARRRLATVGVRAAPAGPGYGAPGADDRSLEWAGDVATPGVEPGAPPVASNGGGQAALAPTAPAAPAPTPTEQSFVYSDGLEGDFGPVPEVGGDTQEELAEDSARGIDGPIPDDDPAAMAEALDEPGPEDPYSSRFVSAHSGNFRRRPASKGPRPVERIVIHITDGGSKLNGTVGWFRNPAAKVSSHYIVGRDGEIVQMVRHNDVAWHANNANGNSIGIEHNANTRGLMPTEPQYRCSARLVAWLCHQYGIPVDRDHVLGHSEADTRTTHTSCPNAVWDWDTYMQMLDEEVAALASQESGFIGNGGSAQSLVRPLAAIDVHYDDVEAVPQLTGVSCWAAAAAMVVGWRDMISIDPSELARREGRWSEYGETGLYTNDNDEFARAWGLAVEPPMTYTIEGFAQLLRDNGPLWVGRLVDGSSGHAVTVIGVTGDGSPDGTEVIFHDPWPPDQGTPSSRVSYRTFMTEFEDFVTVDPDGRVNNQILHGNGRRPLASSQAVARPLAAIDIEWADVESVGQPTGVSCWAAAAAMVVGWRDRISINPEEFARHEGRWSEYNESGLWTNSNDEFAAAWGLVVEPPMSYTVEGFARVLESNGPLWIGRLVGGSSGHAVCVYGLRGDGTPDGTQVIYHDPWPPGEGRAASSISYATFMQEFEDFITVDPDGRVNNQILHSGGTDGRSPNTSYAYGLQARAEAQTGVEVGAAIAGAVITRILDDEGDVEWELDQMRGIKKPWDRDDQAGTPVFQTTTVSVPGPHGWIGWGLDHIYADLEVTFQHNGRSVGNVQAAITDTDDAVGLGLRVKAQIMDEANAFTAPGFADAFAAVKVRIQYTFDNVARQDTQIAITDLVLYGNGTFNEHFRWTQRW
jgi:N-acetyl-anhydromuramyl-L-alanine amidase AmpD